MNIMRALGLAAIGAVLVFAAPVERAQALSLASPAAVTTIQEGSKVTTEVRWRRHWRRHRCWRCRW
jgi:hypothetical protein